jgi:Cd(II)/Pb(II)-responsive transcriptional regulator
MFAVRPDDPGRHNAGMKIGELAKAAHTRAETIRYYEQEGLLPAPARTGSNYRDYGPEHLRRLAFIRQCRGLDMTLEEIKSLLRFKDDPLANCAAVNDLLDGHIAHVAERLRELRRLQAELKGLRAQCDAAGAACGILRTLDARGARPKALPRGRGGHVGGTHGH